MVMETPNERMKAIPGLLDTKIATVILVKLSEKFALCHTCNF